MDTSAASSDTTRECPYCNEDIKAEAIKCKHCGSRVQPETPRHGGVCPFCKESIKPEAVRCKHWRSDLEQPIDAGSLGCAECKDREAEFPLDVVSSGFRVQRAAAPTRLGEAGNTGGVLILWISARTMSGTARPWAAIP